MILQIIFGVFLHVLPVYGRFDGPPPSGVSFFGFHVQTGIYTLDSLLSGNLHDFINALSHLILPSLALGIVISGVFVRITRANLLETIRADFVTAARARGLRERTILVSYALKNAMLPVVTVIGLQFAILLSGAVLTETEFSIQGLGLYLVDRVNFRDYTAVQGTVVFLAVIITTVSLVIDILYAYLDPRVRL
jgi:peptide/nickel transport system permease protein